MPLLTKLPGGTANFSYKVSLENALRRLRARQDRLPFRGTLSTCQRHPSRGLSFFHVNGSCQREITILENRFVVMTYQRTWMYRALTGDVFEAQTATRSELFSCLNCLHNATFTLWGIFSLVERRLFWKSRRHHCTGTRNAHLRFPSLSQKRRLLRLYNNTRACGDVEFLFKSSTRYFRGYNINILLAIGSRLNSRFKKWTRYNSYQTHVKSYHNFSHVVIRFF